MKMDNICIVHLIFPLIIIFGVGDALMTQESLDVAFGSGSTVISMAIANGIMVEAVKIMLENDFPPLYLKAATLTELKNIIENSSISTKAEFRCWKSNLFCLF